MGQMGNAANQGGLSFAKLSGAIATGQLIYNAATTAFHALEGGIKDTMQAAEENQNVQAQLESALKSTAGAAGLQAQDLYDQADALQRVTTFSHAQTEASQALLLTFTNIRGEMFQKTTPAILDMATAMHEDLQTATIQVGKAMNDPIQGMTALRRVGVTFNEQQKEQIKTMEKAGNLAGAQSIILQELQKEFGGSAEAAGKTFAGSMQRLNNQFTDMKEKVGSAILNAIEPFVEKLANFVSSDKFQKWLDDTTKILVTQIIPAAVKFVEILFHIAMAVAQVIMFLTKHKEILGALAGIILAFLVPALIAWAVSAGAAAIATIAATWPVILLGAVIGALAMLVITHWKTIVNAIGTAVNFIKQHLKEFGIAILILSGPIGWLVAAVGAAVMYVVQHWNQLKTDVGNAINGVINFIKNLLNTIAGIPGAVAKGIGNVAGAITGPFKSAFDWIKNNVGSVVNKLKDLNPFMKHSPSLVELVTAGTKEITSQYGKMYKNLGQMATGNGATAHAPAVVPGASAAQGAGGAVQNVNIQNVHLHTAEATKEFFRQLGRNQELTGMGLTPVGY
jgi:phage-related protein